MRGLAKLRRGYRGVERKLVWIMGSPRGGNTWLMQLLRDDAKIVAVPEPLIGMHLGVFTSNIADVSADVTQGSPRISDLRSDPNYFFATQFAGAWQPALRRLLLVRFAEQVPRSARACVVSEPNGSEGADVILSALPHSRVIFLLRDGRDVVDSMLDASRPGAWLDEAFRVGQARSTAGRAAYLVEQSHRWVVRTRVVRDAYDRHPPGLRRLVRYEDLLSDTLGQVRDIHSWLNIRASGDLGARVVARSFSSVPAEQRGPGKFHRAATPGLWRQNLSLEEQGLCERIMGPTLRSLGYLA